MKLVVSVADVKEGEVVEVIDKSGKSHVLSLRHSQIVLDCETGSCVIVEDAQYVYEPKTSKDA